MIVSDERTQPVPTQSAEGESRQSGRTAGRRVPFDGAIGVYVYGVPHSVHGVRTTLPPEVDQQLHLAHDLREDLVTLQLRYEDRKRDIWSSVPDISAIESTLAETEARIVETARQVATERSAGRTRGQTASSPLLVALRRTKRELSACRQELINAAKPTVDPQLAEAVQDLEKAIKDLYGAYCQEGELYWASYNDVLTHHRTAVNQINKERKKGRPAQLRHHRFDGSGAIAVQLQRAQGQPQRSPEVLSRDGSAWRNVLHLHPWIPAPEWGALSPPEQRRRRLGSVRFSLGHGRHVELPIIVHRMMPPEADVTGARLVVYRRGGHRKVELHVTARLPKPPSPPPGSTVAIHLGWRRDEDDLRVCTWRSTEPVTVPPSLSSIVIQDTDRSGWLRLPAAWLHRTQAHAQIASQRAIAQDRMREKLVTALESSPHEELPASDVARWRSPGRFAALAIRWRIDAPQAHTTTATMLEDWRRGDRLLWEPQAHGTAGAIAARDDMYRRFAHWLTSTASSVVVDDTVLSDLARRKPDREQDIPGVVADQASRQRTSAAPGRLRTIVIAAARKRGITEEEVSHTGLSRTHYRCGHQNPADDRYAASRVVRCDGCGGKYDQDASATLLMLAANGKVPPAGQATTRNTT